MRDRIEADVVRWRNDTEREARRDEVACEEPLEIRINGRAVSVTMRTPGHDAELALGFLLTEGMIRGRDEVAEVSAPMEAEVCNTVDVQLAADVSVDFERLTRHVFASSSCGLCGKTTIDAIRQLFPPIASEVRVQATTLAGLPDQLRARQENFSRTGGLHAAGIFRAADGAALIVREDVGRHNAVDKVIGWALREGLLPLAEHVLVVSGRASFEIVQKALAARLPILAAVSAPSSLAVRFAADNRQTLAGFVRDGGLNIYTGAERIVG